jgi:hypothetical protein
MCVCAWISLTLCYPWTGQMLSCVVTLARTSMVAWQVVFIPRGGEPERKRSWLGEAQLRATAIARSTGTPPPLFIQRRVETREARQAAGGFRFRRIQGRGSRVVSAQMRLRREIPCSGRWSVGPLEWSAGNHQSPRPTPTLARSCCLVPKP